MSPDETHRDESEQGDQQFRFYFGAASGSSRKALRQLEEPNVMLNYATKMNEPWDGIERLFIDSGGYSFVKGKGEYDTDDATYLDFIGAHAPELFALRDYPCEPDVLAEHGRRVEDHQQRTLRRHRSLLDLLEDRDLPGTPLAVLQGWSIDDYLRCIDLFRDHGVLTDYVGIGSVCRRNQEAEIRRIIVAVRDALPPRVRLHAFSSFSPARSGRSADQPLGTRWMGSRVADREHRAGVAPSPTVVAHYATELSGYGVFYLVRQ